MNDFNNYIDIEFRKIIWPDYNHSNHATMNDLLQMKKCALCIIQSSMEFTTILFSFPNEITANKTMVTMGNRFTSSMGSF